MNRLGGSPPCWRTQSGQRVLEVSDTTCKGKEHPRNASGSIPQSLIMGTWVTVEKLGKVIAHGSHSVGNQMLFHPLAGKTLCH